MSAQIITALRRRAAALEAEAEDPATPHKLVAYTEHCYAAKDPVSLRWLAAEFRALADEAEGRP